MTNDRATMTPRPEWGRAVALGAWLSGVALWPVAMLPVGKTHLLWQPFLLLSLLVLSVGEARRSEWGSALAQSLYLGAFFTLAAWLPMIRTIPSTATFSYPHGYTYYLALYEAAFSALVGCQAFWAASGRAPSWWPAGPWSRPLVMAPVVLLGRAIAVGHGISPLIGIMLGFLMAVLVSRQRPGLVLGRRGTVVPWMLVGAAVGLVVASGMRFYLQLGADYPLNSDDGISYFQSAEEIAKDPRRIWTPPAFESNMFSLYVVLMGLWFRIVGTQIPSWLAWQGLAAGLLAVMVYRLGQHVSGSRLVGMAAAALVTFDHVMLHLMATLNMEVAFIPALYVAAWLWSTVPEQPPRAQLRRCVVAGVAVGFSALFRPTSGLFPLVLVGALFLERPKLSWRNLMKQAGGLFAGFAAPIALLLIRHRVAWGHWTTGDASGAPLSWNANYAWVIQGQHPYKIGWGPWLRLLASDPSVIWREMIPNWWAQILYLWTHHGFGQMDFVQGLNYSGVYQAAFMTLMAVGISVGAAVALRRRRRADLVLLALPAYFTGLALIFWVINTRYRAPFIPALYVLAGLGCSLIARTIRQGATQSARRPALSPTPLSALASVQRQMP